MSLCKVLWGLGSSISEPKICEVEDALSIALPAQGQWQDNETIYWSNHSDEMQLTSVCPSGWKWKNEVAQLCPTLCDPKNCSPPGSSVHRIFQARVLEWVAISFSRASSQPRDPTCVSRIVGSRFTLWATKFPNPDRLGGEGPDWGGQTTMLLRDGWITRFKESWAESA